MNAIPCFSNCRSEHGGGAFDIQIIREESRYLRYGLPGKAIVLKVPVKDLTDSLNEERLFVRGVVFVGVVISTQFYE